jgi:ribosome maturation factor RimP
LPRDVQIDQIRAIAGRVAASHGLEIFDVQLRRESIGWVLRVVIDRPAGSGAPVRAPELPDDTVSIEDCQRVSQDIGAILDVEDPVDRQYTLEVSSPGLDRPLRRAADYARFAGRLAKIVVAEPVDGQRHFEGRLKGLEGEDTVVVEVGRHGKQHRIPLASIARARLEVEF